MIRPLTHLLPLVALALFTTEGAGLAAVGAPPPPVSPLASLTYAPPVTIRLDNGLRVVVAEDHRAPRVAMTLAYRVGSADDPEDRPGIASLTAWMMEAGSVHVPPADRTRILQSVGASMTSATNLDFTYFSASAPSSSAAALMWLWSDAMGFFVPRADQAMLDRARDLAGNQRQERFEDALTNHIDGLLREALYPASHPYHGVARAPSKAISVNDVRAFFDRHFAPDDAVLVVVGDVDPKAIGDLARTYFGPIPAAGLTAPAPSAPPVAGLTQLDIAARVAQPAVVIDWITPRLGEEDDAALDVAYSLLAGRHMAHLTWNLVDQAKLATRVRAHQQSHERASEFQLWVDVAPGRSPYEVLSAVDTALHWEFHRRAWPSALDTAISDLILPRMFALDDPGTRASAYARYTLEYDDPNGFARDLGRYERMSITRVEKAVDTWLGSTRRVIAFVHPDPGAPPGGVARDTHVFTPPEAP